MKGHFISIDNDVFEGLYTSICTHSECKHIPELSSHWKTDDTKTYVKTE